jgi:subtilisin family serine protease
LATVARQFDFSKPVTNANYFQMTGRPEYLHDSGAHGTGTASVACSTNNGLGFAGMANFESNRISIIECRISNDGANADYINILKALIFCSSQMAAHQMPIGPVNLSFGGTPSLNSDPTIQSIAYGLLQAGSILVLASGNDGTFDSSPEIYARRVAATDQTGALASFSTTGPFFSAAPGVQVSCYFPYTFLCPSYRDGTSFAAPRWCAAITDVRAALPVGKRSCYLADQIVFNTANVNSAGWHIPNLQAALISAHSQ